MNIQSDDLKCYIEGVSIPIKSIRSESGKNKLTTAVIEIALGEPIIQKMWANAFIQVTCILSVNGIRKEHLLFQGMCSSLECMELKGTIMVRAVSTFSSLNFNYTLDYTSPKRYSIQNLQGDESKIFLANEEEIMIQEPSSNDSYQLAHRFFFLPEESRNLPANQLDFEERMKMEFIANKTPFAERYAFSFFEDLSYGNFILSRAFIERFNLLSKSKERQKFMKEETLYSEEINYGTIGMEFDRNALAYKWARFKKVKDEKSQGYEGNFNSSKSGYPYKEISQKAKDDILTTQGLWQTQCTINEILSDYDKYGKQMNVDPNLLIAQARQESQFNPKAGSGAGARGWAQFMPGTWPSYAPSGKADFSFVYDVRASIYAQCGYMAWLLNYFKDDMKKAIMGYNAGPGFNQENPPAETAAYWPAILNIYQNYIK